MFRGFFEIGCGLTAFPGLDVYALAIPYDPPAPDALIDMIELIRFNFELTPIPGLYYFIIELPGMLRPTAAVLLAIDVFLYAISPNLQVPVAGLYGLTRF